MYTYNPPHAYYTIRDPLSHPSYRPVNVCSSPSPTRHPALKRLTMLPFDPRLGKVETGTATEDGGQRKPMTLCWCATWLACDVVEQRRAVTISRVHTRLIHTFNFPSTPSTSSNSTPSHQHLRAGFRQKSSSFCAMPTTLLPARSPLMSVRNLASARLQTTALLGSPARWPQRSS